MTPIDAVVFDLDGVLLDSEVLWDRARRQVVDEHGGRWRPEATSAMQGMSSPEWAAHLRRELGVRLDEGRISSLVVAALLEEYHRRLPLLPGAVAAVRRLGAGATLGLASSSNRVVIDEVLELAGISDAFATTVSSEEVARGKPAPDVYLEAVRRLGKPARACAAIEDSANGLRSAASAGLIVIAVPNRDYPPAPGALAMARLVVDSLDELDVDLLRDLAAKDEASDATRKDPSMATSEQPPADKEREAEDREAEDREAEDREAEDREAEDRRVDEEDRESFPASDPPSDWAGPDRP